MEVVERVEALKPADITFYLAYVLRLATLGSVEKDGGSVYIYHSDHPGDWEDAVVASADGKTIIVYEDPEHTVYVVYDYERNKVLGIKIPKN